MGRVHCAGIDWRRIIEDPSYAPNLFASQLESEETASEEEESDEEAYEEPERREFYEAVNVTELLPTFNTSEALRGEILGVADNWWDDANATEEEPEIPAKLRAFGDILNNKKLTSILRPTCVSSLSSGLVRSSYFQYLLETEGLVLAWVSVGVHGSVPDNAVRADPAALGDVIFFARQLKYEDEGVKMLKAVEISAQEAAWYLLGLGMSHASRVVVIANTSWPEERVRIHKSRELMDRDGLDVSSTYVLCCIFTDVKCIIIDESSMMSADTLVLINRKLRTISLKYMEPFGGFDVTLCSDLGQLPPSDERFATILAKIGDGMGLALDEVSLLESRFVTTEDAAKCLYGVGLFCTNEDADAFHIATAEACTEYAIHCPAIGTICGHRSDEVYTHAKARVATMCKVEMGNLAPNILLCLEKPYMVIRNIDVSDSLVNCSVGILRRGQRDTDNSPRRLWIEFPTGVGAAALLKGRRYRANDPDICGNWVPIELITIRCHLKGNGLGHITVMRKQFPVIQASAITIHKTQGGTYDEVVVDYSKLHNQKLVYVALSRVTTSTGCT
ncbi:hypothetical protein V5799_016915 [Amblyomma americanum]|uniref:ATP-dependent DNA helicase n=1 Tax=Amblyomma americanum TaxID=6943 RepID=A0AAQ4F3T8_AMBAM